MKIWAKQDISITGKKRNQRVFVKLGSGSKEKPLSIEAYGENGDFVMRGGDAFARGAFKQWCRTQFKTEKPPFPELFEHVWNLDPPPVNPKSPSWLK